MPTASPARCTPRFRRRSYCQVGVGVDSERHRVGRIGGLLPPADLVVGQLVLLAERRRVARPRSCQKSRSTRRSSSSRAGPLGGRINAIIRPQHHSLLRLIDVRALGPSGAWSGRLSNSRCTSRRRSCRPAATAPSASSVAQRPEVGTPRPRRNHRRCVLACATRARAAASSESHCSHPRRRCCHRCLFPRSHTSRA